MTMNDKELRKFYRRQFAPIRWWLVGYYFLMNVAVIGAIEIQRILFNPTTEQLNGNAWGYLAACIIGMLIMLLWKGVPFWKDKVLARGRAMEFKDFMILLMLTIGCQLAASVGAILLELLLSAIDLSAQASIESATSQPDTFSMFLYVGVFAPVFEELIFRGFVMQSLKPFGKKFAILGAAILALKTKNMKPEDDTKIEFMNAGSKRVYITMGILFAYVAVLEFLGFIIATTIMEAVFLHWFAKKKPWITAVMALVITLVIYAVFQFVQNVPVGSFGILAF